jgi:hypothetical protein
MSNPLLSTFSRVSCAVILTALCLFCAGTATAQISTYSFSAAGGFTPLSGATVQTLDGGTLDDGFYPSAPIGFTFTYDNTNYALVGANTNGWMSMGSVANDINQTSFRNDLSGTPNRPLIAPLWDDLEVDPTGSVSYLTEGVAPNRVFTMQWLNMQWTYEGTAPAITFQVKLYETTNRIQFIYRQEASALVSGASGDGASIGLAGALPGNFLSLNNSGASPTASSTTESNLIFSKPATGQSYVFSPPSIFPSTAPYNFAAGVGFTALSGATVQTLAGGSADNGYYPLAPIGFTFRYANANYTQVSANTNGWMRLGLTANDVGATGFTNSLATTPNRPLIAPLWDDLEVDPTGSVSYLTEGVAPNRVFTMQWLNMQWTSNGTAPAITFQVKLYETTNRVEFVYRPEAAALTTATFQGASIGLTGTTLGDFLSLNNSSAAPTASSTVETTSIFTKPGFGQSYRFTPVAPTAAGVSISGRVLASGGGLVNATVSLTDQMGGVQSSRTTTFGNYHFENVAAGQTVVITVVSKRFQFSPQVFNITDNLADVNFIAEESK